MITLKNAGGAGENYAKLTFSKGEVGHQVGLELYMEDSSDNAVDMQLNLEQAEKLALALLKFVKVNTPKAKASLFSGSL